MSGPRYVYATTTFFPIGSDVGVAVGQQFSADDPLVRRFPSQFRAFVPPAVNDASFTPPDLEAR